MQYFNTYPVTPKMGLRESIHAMLDYAAFARSWGYDAPSVQASNCRSLLADYSALLVETVEGHTDVLRLRPRIDDSALLADLIDALVSLCNDYPVFDDGDLNALENERELAAIDYARADSDPEAETILYAFHELGLYLEHENDGSVYFSETDYAAAVQYAHKTPRD